MEIDEKLRKKAFIIPITAIVVRDDGRFLVLKRADWEAAFPGKWTVPGGKFEEDDFIHLPPTTKDYRGWYGVLEPALLREVHEETGVAIHDIRYLTNYVFETHPKYGVNVLGLSFWARYKSGDVTLQDPGLVGHAWATIDELKEIDLIEGIYDEIRQVVEVLSKEK